MSDLAAIPWFTLPGWLGGGSAQANTAQSDSSSVHHHHHHHHHHHPPSQYEGDTTFGTATGGSSFNSDGLFTPCESILSGMAPTSTPPARPRLATIPALSLPGKAVVVRTPDSPASSVTVPEGYSPAEMTTPRNPSPMHSHNSPFQGSAGKRFAVVKYEDQITLSDTPTGHVEICALCRGAGDVGVGVDARMRVSHVQEGSPAYRAGLAAYFGARIVAINGVTVGTPEGAAKALNNRGGSACVMFLLDPGGGGSGVDSPQLSVTRSVYKFIPEDEIVGGIGSARRSRTVSLRTASPSLASPMSTNTLSVSRDFETPRQSWSIPEDPTFTDNITIQEERL